MPKQIPPKNRIQDAPEPWVHISVPVNKIIADLAKKVKQ